MDSRQDYALFEEYKIQKCPDLGEKNMRRLKKINKTSLKTVCIKLIDDKICYINLI